MLCLEAKMYNIEAISDEELQAELNRREEEKRKSEKPQQLAIVDPDPLRKMCQEYIDELDKSGYVDDDFDHYIYEAAMTMVFGKDVWMWINKQLK